MNEQVLPQEHFLPVCDQPPQTRSRFIIRTYLHVLGAILGFVGIEVALFTSGWAEPMAEKMLGGSWLLVLGAFIVVSWIGTRVAHTARSLASQYAALIAVVIFEALIFVPMLYMAENYAEGGVIANAALTTIVGFLGLTAIVFGTAKDFSFLRGIIMWAGFCAFGLIIGAILFGFELGPWFSIAMIVLAGGAILYDTSNVLRHYPEDRYVGAALQLFTSVAMMFWYLLRLFMGRD